MFIAQNLKKWLSLALTVTMLAFLVPAIPLASAYSGPDAANYEPDAVYIHLRSSSNYYDMLTEATDDTADDLTLDAAGTDAKYYIGFEQPFDGISIDFTSGEVGYIANERNGKFDLEYYTSSGGWASLGVIDADLEGAYDLTNDNGNVEDSDYFTFTWDVPDNWNTIAISTTDSYYYVRLRVADEYPTSAYAGRIGVIAYNMMLSVSDELGNALTGLSADDFEFEGEDSTIYSLRENEGTYEFALDASSGDFSYQVVPDGYVGRESTTRLSKASSTVELDPLDFAHKFFADDGYGNTVEIASVSLSGGDCDVSEGLAYCAIGLDADDEGSVTLYADGFVAAEVATEDRSSALDEQVSYAAVMDYAYLLSLQDADGEALTGAEVTLGELGLECVDLNNGDYGCALPAGESPDYVVSMEDIEATGSFEVTRTDASDAQESISLALNVSGEFEAVEEATGDLEDWDAEDAAIDCEHDFTDLEGHWGEQAICLVTNAGAVDALSDGIYGPNVATTRVDFLKLALLNAGYDVEAVEGVEYSDVNEDDEAYKWVSFASDMGFVHGYDDGSFRPDAEINRVEALIMILKVAGVEAFDVPAEDLPFSDVEPEDWYAWVVYAGVHYGLVQGYADGSFKPGNDITRAEMAVVARRVLHAFYTELL